MPQEPDSFAYAQSVERLIEQFVRLPGVGRRSAERMAFHVLNCEKDEAMKLSQAVADVKQKIGPCRICYNLTDTDPCKICASPRRDGSLLMIVERPKDLISLEQTGSFPGVYHVLMGRLDPLAGVDTGDLTIADLIARVEDPQRNCRGVAIKEVILGLNPDLEGDSTALYLSEQLKPRGVQVTRLARGLPTGSQLEYVSRAVLVDAIQGRQSMD